jgi:Ca2+-binding EF-hand superfamily protein
MDNSNQASTNYREAFQLFDKRGNGRVDRSALGDLLRACGQNPTLAEIGDLERGVGNDCTFLHTSYSTPLRASHGHLPHGLREEQTC